MDRDSRSDSRLGLRGVLDGDVTSDAGQERLLRRVFWSGVSQEPTPTLSACTSLLEFRSRRPTVTSSNPKHPK